MAITLFAVLFMPCTIYLMRLRGSTTLKANLLLTQLALLAILVSMTINEYLKLTEITRKDLAEKAGCSPIWLWYVANGKRRPSFTLSDKLVEASQGKITLEGIRQPFRKMEPAA